LQPVREYLAEQLRQGLTLGRRIPGGFRQLHSPAMGADGAALAATNGPHAFVQFHGNDLIGTAKQAGHDCFIAFARTILPKVC